MFASLNSQYAAMKRAASDREFILESVLGVDEVLPGSEEEMEDQVDIDSVPEDAYRKLDSLLDKLVSDPKYDDTEVDEMYDDDYDETEIDDDILDIIVDETVDGTLDLNMILTGMDETARNEYFAAYCEGLSEGFGQLYDEIPLLYEDAEDQAAYFDALDEAYYDSVVEAYLGPGVDLDVLAEAYAMFDDDYEELSESVALNEFGSDRVKSARFAARAAKSELRSNKSRFRQAKADYRAAKKTHDGDTIARAKQARGDAKMDLKLAKARKKASKYNVKAAKGLDHIDKLNRHNEKADRIQAKRDAVLKARAEKENAKRKAAQAKEDKKKEKDRKRQDKAYNKAQQQHQKALKKNRKQRGAVHEGTSVVDLFMQEAFGIDSYDDIDELDEGFFSKKDKDDDIQVTRRTVSEDEVPADIVKAMKEGKQQRFAQLAYGSGKGGKKNEGYDPEDFVDLVDFD